MSEREELVKRLQGLAIWMTGCGYDFTQHEHYMRNRHLMTDDLTTQQQGIDSLRKNSERYRYYRDRSNSDSRFYPAYIRGESLDKVTDAEIARESAEATQEDLK